MFKNSKINRQNSPFPVHGPIVALTMTNGGRILCGNNWIMMSGYVRVFHQRGSDALAKSLWSRLIPIGRGSIRRGTAADFESLQSSTGFATLTPDSEITGVCDCGSCLCGRSEMDDYCEFNNERRLFSTQKFMLQTSTLSSLCTVYIFIYKTGPTFHVCFYAFLINNCDLLGVISGCCTEPAIYYKEAKRLSQLSCCLWCTRSVPKKPRQRLKF